MQRFWQKIRFDGEKIGGQSKKWRNTLVAVFCFFSLGFLKRRNKQEKVFNMKLCFLPFDL